MDYSEYVARLSTYQDIDLKETERSYLSRIISGREPGYGLSSYLRLKRQPVAWKDDQIVLKKLEKMNLIEETEGKFLRGSFPHKLTTHGLFYIFSNMVNYPPQLLLKYQENILLKVLLYPYFQADTIRQCTARIYPAITQYLQESCKMTFEMLNYFRTADNSEDKRRYAKQLEENLEWSAKLLLFKLTIMYNESNLLSATSNIIDENAKVALYQLEDTMRTVLYNDKMFTRQLSIVEAEFREGYSALVGPK
jgi:hypothetical protein